ncbi:MAG: hypothetical protein WBW61_08295, partial [Rhodanobacteraceae bacterium]
MAAVLPFSTGFAASAADSGGAPSPLLQVTLDPASDRAMPLARQIAISGAWPNDCPPEVDGVALEATDLTINARFPTTGCDASHPTHYRLDVSPSAVTGLPQLPAQVYQTRVFLAPTNGAPTLAAFRLLDATATQTAPRPESGFWWSQSSKQTGAALAGSGLSLEFQDHRLAAGLLGFDDTGNATWYFGSAPLEGRVAHVPLVSLSRGDGPFQSAGSRPLAEPGPRIEIEFQSPTRALAWLVRDQGNGTLDVRALSISRSLFVADPAGSAWSGRWVLLREGEDSAHVFDLRSLSVADADSFHLSDPSTGDRLDCRIDIASRTPDPDLC